MKWQPDEEPDFYEEARLAAIEMIKDKGEQDLLNQYELMIAKYRAENQITFLDDVDLAAERTHFTALLPAVIPVLEKVDRLTKGILASGNDGEMMPKAELNIPPFYY
jgi:hypothetical protein